MRRLATRPWSIADAAGWHARAAWCRKSRTDFIAYVSSRAAVILFYVGAAAMLSLTGSHYSALHVHHLYLGFAIAMWAEFDHPVSPLHPCAPDSEVVISNRVQLLPAAIHK